VRGGEPKGMRCLLITGTRRPIGWSRPLPRSRELVRSVPQIQLSHLSRRNVAEVDVGGGLVALRVPYALSKGQTATIGRQFVRPPRRKEEAGLHRDGLGGGGSLALDAGGRGEGDRGQEEEGGKRRTAQAPGALPKGVTAGKGEKRANVRPSWPASSDGFSASLQHPRPSRDRWYPPGTGCGLLISC